MPAALALSAQFEIGVPSVGLLSELPSLSMSCASSQTTGFTIGAAEALATNEQANTDTSVNKVRLSITILLRRGKQKWLKTNEINGPDRTAATVAHR